MSREGVSGILMERMVSRRRPPAWVVALAKRVLRGRGRDLRYAVATWLLWARTRAEALRGGFRGIWRGSIVDTTMPGRARLVSHDVTSPGRGELLVEVVASAVSSGTEGAAFARLPNTAPMKRPGYSAAGYVVKVGPKTRWFRVGDRVAFSGSHASLALVLEDQAFWVPSEVSLEAASFVQLGVIALQGVRKANIQAGEKVVVLGRGVVGQLTVQLAANCGGYPIVSVARSPDRTTEALSRYAQHLVALRECEEGFLDSLEADITFEATGNPMAIVDALRCTRPGGRILLVGSSRGATHNMDFSAVAQSRDVTIIGAHISSVPRHSTATERWTYEREAHTFLRFVQQGQVDVEGLIGERVNPHEANWFYQRLTKREKPVVGAVFAWDQLLEKQRMKRISYLSPPSGDPVKSVMYPMAPMPRNSQQPLRSALFRSPRSVNTMSKADGGVRHSKSNMLSVALIGCGARGRTIAKSLSRVSNTRLSMVVDVDAEQGQDLARDYRVPWSPTLSEAADLSDVDAVYIAIPHLLHSALIQEAVSYGKHIMVEKPLATTVEAAARAVVAAHQAKVKLSVSFNQRYFAHILRARELIQEGVLGRLLGVQLTVHVDRGANYWAGGTDWRASWEESGGGYFFNTGCHNLDWLRFVTGQEITEVSAMYATVDSLAAVDDTMCLSLRYGNGALGTINCASCVRGVSGGGEGALVEFRLWGTDGHISLTRPYQVYSLRASKGRRAGRWHLLDQMSPRDHGIMDGSVYIQRFAEAVLSGNEPDISGEDGLKVQAVLEAAYRSAREGRAIRVEESSSAR